MKQYKEEFFKIMIVFLHQEHRFRKIITYDVKFELKYNSFFPALSILMTWLSIFKKKNHHGISLHSVHDFNCGGGLAGTVKLEK